MKPPEARGCDMIVMVTHAGRFGEFFSARRPRRARRQQAALLV